MVQLADSRARCKGCLDLEADATKRYYRLRIYSSQLLDENNDKASSQELDQRANNLGIAFGEAVSSFAPQILAIGEQQINGWLAEDKSLAIYRHQLADILRGKAHTLAAQGEAIVATLSATADTAQTVYGMLSSADLPWPTLKLDGKEVQLDQAAYTKYRSAADRDERKQVVNAFFGKIGRAACRERVGQYG